MTRQPAAGVTVPLRVTPRARADAIAGWRGGRLHIRTTAPPLDGRATDAALRLLAAALKVAPSAVRLVRGAHSREKTAEVYGLPADDIYRRLRGGSAS